MPFSALARLQSRALPALRQAKRYHAGMNAVCTEILDEARATGTYKSERVITTAQSSSVGVQGSQREVLNFCANNYLGLANHPELIQAAKGALDTHGFGMASVRFICGTQDIHKNLEGVISNFHSMEDTILFPSGFDANAGLFEAILNEKDAIISDALNHASIIDGIRLCKAKRYRYEHMNLADLEAKLKDAVEAGTRLRMVATDGVFSMDGDIAPLKDIKALCEKYDAILMIDECHAGGHLGKTGRGTPELTGAQPDIITSTLGKALGGGTGGYCSGPKELIDLLRNKARTYLFSNSMAPNGVAASLKAFELIEKDPKLMATLHGHVGVFRDGLKKAGFTVSGHDECPIVPIMIGDAAKAKAFADACLDLDIYVIAFSYPVVPKETARIRCQLSAAHTSEQIQQALKAFEKIGKDLKII